MKRFRFILLLAAVCCATHAQNTVTLYLKNGSNIGYSFGEKPVMTYSGNELVVSTQTIQVRYPIESLARICFEDHPETAMQETVRPDVLFCVDAGAITITGERPGSETYLYNLNGSCLGRQTVGTDGSAEIPIGELPGGIYVIKTCSISFKIRKP